MAPSNTAFVLHSSVKAETKLIIEIACLGEVASIQFVRPWGSKESNFCDFIWNCRHLAHFTSILATSSSYWDDLSTKCNVRYSNPPGCYQSQRRYLTTLCLGDVWFSPSDQPTSRCPSQRPVLYSNECVAHAPIACGPQMLFASDSRTSFVTTQMRTNVVLHPCFPACYLDGSSGILKISICEVPHSQIATSSAVIHSCLYCALQYSSALLTLMQYHTSYFPFSSGVSVLRLANVAIGVINEQEFNNLFNSFTVATSMMKWFAIRPSNTSPMTSSCSTSNITCSSTI